MYRIEREIKENAKRIDEALHDRLDESEIGIGKLADAMRYSVENGGKRIRAFLVMECCRMFGGDASAALPYALAIEFGHAASLIHDDMPCMDDDDLRRGKPSCHVRFDEYTALLAGDALLSLAFEVIVSNPHLTAETNLLAAKIFSHNVGVKGMCLGQQNDLDGADEGYESLKETYRLKTGLAIQVSMVLGCLAAGKPIGGALEQKINLYAEKVGFAFQVIDDLSDVYGSVEEIGKPVGSDHKNKKRTVLSFLSKAEAEALAAGLLDEAAELFGKEVEGNALRELAHHLKRRMGVRVGALQLGANAMRCFEQVEATRRYDFTKRLMEVTGTDHISDILHEYGCNKNEKGLEELIFFLQQSKFVQYKKYKDRLYHNKLFPFREREGSCGNKDKRIIIVGAGAAGTMCAFLLKRAGFNVLLLERHALDKKTKLCGGILSDKSVELLISIFGEEVTKIFKQSMDDVSFFSDEDSSIDAKKRGYVTVVRKELDDYLLKRYLSIGGEVYDQISVNKIDETEQVLCVTRRESNENIYYPYDVLIAADGANSTIRKKTTGKKQKTMLAIEAEVAPVGDRFIMSSGELSPGFYGYCWYIPQGDTANIGCGYAKKDADTYYSADATEMKQKLAVFAKQIGVEFTQESIKGAMLPCAEVLLQRGQTYFIGDAAGLINAQTGEGIYYALVSALLLKNAIAYNLDYEGLMRQVTTEISLTDESREEFYDILTMLMNG